MVVLDASALLALTFGERACLALAKHMRCPAVTADRAWLDVDIGVEIQIVR